MTDLVLIATIGGQRVAIAAAAIESIVDLWQVVRVPLAAPHVIGLAALRSRVLTVIDAAAAVGLRATATGNRAIVIAADGHRYALRVDSVGDCVVPLGPPGASDASRSANWGAIATGTVDTEHGFALLIDPVQLIGGQLAETA